MTNTFQINNYNAPLYFCCVYEPLTVYYALLPPLPTVSSSLLLTLPSPTPLLLPLPTVSSSSLLLTLPSLLLPPPTVSSLFSPIPYHTYYHYYHPYQLSPPLLFSPLHHTHYTTPYYHPYQLSLPYLRLSYFLRF